jgi:hypothetical protein
VARAVERGAAQPSARPWRIAMRGSIRDLQIGVRAVDRATDLAPTIAQFCSFFGGTAAQTTW